MKRKGQVEDEEPTFEPTPKDPVLRQKIWDDGEHIEDYACDAGVDEEGNEVVESNGSIENKIRYEGKIYLLHTDWGAEPEIYDF